MRIERVTVDDAPKLLNIYAPYVEETAISFEYEVPTLEEFTNRIKNITVKYPYYKAVDGDVTVGYAYATSFKVRPAYDWSVETTIYIRKDLKRMGAGRALYSKLEESLGKMGILNMNACIASPREANEYVGYDSINFHKKMGFEMVGLFHNSGYKFDRWHDMVWMEKMIGEHNAYPEKVRFGEW